MKKFIASLVAITMILAIGTTVWADETDPTVGTEPTASADVTPGLDATVTADPDATPTPFELLFDFNENADGWYGNPEGGGGHEHLAEGGVDNSGVLSVTVGTSTNGNNSGYYDIGELVAGNIYEVSAKVKCIVNDPIASSRVLITIIQCVYSSEESKWTYKAVPTLVEVNKAVIDRAAEDDESFATFSFEFIAPAMDEGYDQVDKTEFPAYKFDILYMGGGSSVFYFDDIGIKDVTATSTLTPAPVATPVPEVTATPTVTPTATATVEPTKKPVKKVTIKFKKKSVKIKKGKKATLKVTIKNAKKATFSVDKKGKKVVKLSKKKAKSVVVTGKKKGKATITAKASGKKATCKVTVKK